MPVVSFYGDLADLSHVTAWIDAQKDLAVLSSIDGAFVATRRHTWQLPIHRILLWCVEGGPIEAIAGGSFNEIENPWEPFTADDIYVGVSIFQVRLVAEMPDKRLALSSIQWTGGGNARVAAAWRRIRNYVSKSGKRVDNADGEWRYALPGAAAEIEKGREFSRSPP